MKIDMWHVGYGSGVSQYSAPDSYAASLFGRVYGHLIFNDSENVVLSPIMRIENGMVYTRSGSVYELGAPDPVYAKLHPNATERLIAHFTRTLRSA